MYLSKLREGCLDGSPHFFHLGVVAIFCARPEKSAQSVLLAARHNVHVEVRHALAHPVIDCEEGPLGSCSLFDRLAEDPRAFEERTGIGGRQVGQCGVVGPRDDQAMSREQRAVIQEGKKTFVLEDDRSGHLAGGDLAKGAGGRHLPIMPDREAGRGRVLS